MQSVMRSIVGEEAGDRHLRWAYNLRKKQRHGTVRSFAQSSVQSTLVPKYKIAERSVIRLEFIDSKPKERRAVTYLRLASPFPELCLED